jgi:pyruvate formate lyase activating enzyme
MDDRNSKGMITEIVKFATHDGPGIRTSIFIKGCPLRCKWCSNPETVKPYPEIWFIARKCTECGECIKVCPDNAISMDKEHKIDRQKCTLCMRCVEACKNKAIEKIGMEVTPEEVAEIVKSDRPFFIRSGGGVTASGGEPLCLPNFTSCLFKLCHEYGITTVLDTCGYAPPEHLEQVLNHTDLVLLDIKHMSPTEHEKGTGITNEVILENAKLMARKCKVRISLPLIPKFNDSEDNVRKTAEFACSLGISAIDIEPLHKLGTSKYEYLDLKSPFSDFEDVTEEKVKEVIKIIESHGLKTTKRRTM